MFEKFDLTGDGMIEKSEFHGLVNTLGHHMDPETFEAAWVEVETDGSGRLSYAEFAAWWSTDDRWAHLQLSDDEIANLEQVHNYFTYYDEKKDGQLDHHEFANVYNYLTESGYILESLDLVMAEIDTSKDGTVNYNEVSLEE